MLFFTFLKFGSVVTCLGAQHTPFFFNIWNNVLLLCAGGKQPADRAESRAARRGTAGPGGPAQTRISGGPDPPAGPEGGAGCFGHATPGPAATDGPVEPAGLTHRVNTNTGIRSLLTFSDCAASFTTRSAFLTPCHPVL